MRTLMLIAPALLLSGCNLFRSGLIEQTCEDLPGGCGGIDSQPTDDTGDTAPWVPPNPFSQGLVISKAVGDQVVLQAYGADGVLLQAASIATADARDPGPVAYDSVHPRLMLWDNAGQQLFVVADGGSPLVVPMDTTTVGEPGDVLDAVVVDSALYLVTSSAVWVYLPDAGSVAPLATPSGVAAMRSVFPAYADNLFLLNWSEADQRPDLYRLTISTAEARLSYENFDDSLGRATSGFQGPADKPFVCSEVGGVYSVETLLSGTRTPEAFPSQDDVEALGGGQVLSGVVDCGWDDGADRYLLLAPSLGVLTMDEWGRLDLLQGPGADERLLRAAFFAPFEGDAG